MTVGELLCEAVPQSGINDIDDWILMELVCAEELGQSTNRPSFSQFNRLAYDYAVFVVHVLSTVCS